MSVRIILASASPRRRQLLLQVGLCPEIMPSDADEKVEGLSPEETVKLLSARKAREVAERLTDTGSGGAVVIGADTVVAVDGQILGKPADAGDAARMLRLIQGRSHHVYTGVTLVLPGSGQVITFAECTEVEVYPMTSRQIEQYIATGEPADKAGSYGIQGLFAAYVKGIRGDYNNVVGLPTGRLCQELIHMGVMPSA